MRIGVTGSTGFLGGHLVDLLRQEHNLVLLSRAPVEVPPGCQCRPIGEITSATDWGGRLADLDAVVHLAARVHVMNETPTASSPAYREVNVDGTRALAEAAAAQGVKRFIFMSSIKVNGDGAAHHPISIDDTPTPVDPYGRSKLEAEREISRVVMQSDMCAVSLRSPVVYGLGVKGNIARIVKLIQSGLPIPLGSVHNRRTMLSINNLKEWVTAAIKQPVTGHLVVLMGDPAPVSTAELVRYVSTGMHLRSRLIPFPLSLLTGAGRVVGKESVVQRLVDDFEVVPTYTAFSGLRGRMADPRHELVCFGEQLRDARGSR